MESTDHRMKELANVGKDRKDKMQRSHYLVHWTGKDISKNREDLSESHRNQYIARLFDILENGFWMTTPPEKLHGGHPQGPPASISFTYQVPMTCFTEIRLSAALKHSSQYGLLGVVVDRQFVLDRWGGPVHYVRNNEREHIVASFFELRYLLSKLENGPILREAQRNADYLGLFLKGMSTQGSDDFSMLNEKEWRIIQHDVLVEQGYITHNTQKTIPKYRLLIPPDKIRMIVLPDNDVRAKVCADDRFSNAKWPNELYPAMLTLDDCANL